MTVIDVNIIPSGSNYIYEPSYVSFGDNCVIGCGNSRAMGFLLGYCSKEEQEKRMLPVKAQMEQYNSAVKFLWDTPGFPAFFANHNSYVSHEEIKKHFGNDVAEAAHNVCHITNCYPDLQFVNGYLKLRDAEFNVIFQIEGQSFSYDINWNYVDPVKVNDKVCFWDWSEEQDGFPYALFTQLCWDDVLIGGAANACNENAGYLFSTGCTNLPEFLAMSYVKSLLIERGFLKSYFLKSVNYPELWSYNTLRKDNMVGFYILDPNYKKDKLLTERISVYFESLFTYNPEEECYKESGYLGKKLYFLQDEEDHTYVSLKKAEFGGHKKLKIYGRLDCPSAARFLAKGQYVPQRVFFKDEETAKSAGYRPCAKCMPEAYKKWKLEMNTIR